MYYCADPAKDLGRGKWVYHNTDPKKIHGKTYSLFIIHMIHP